MKKIQRKGEIRDQIYKRTPTRIFLENIIVEGSGRNGIYIDDYVTDVTLQNSVVRDSGGGGVHLEFSSKGNRIIEKTSLLITVFAVMAKPNGKRFQLILHRII